MNILIGARLKNESDSMKAQILQTIFENGTTVHFKRHEPTQLIVNYFAKRAKKDAYSQKRGLSRLEKQVKAGKLTKSSINNKGYNKYLKLTGDLSIEIDYEKYNSDNVWDGLKGYITNTRLYDEQVMDNYKNLWHIERAFRMSKTDLRIRPIYNRLRKRIEAHVCISFTAYCIYKELERILHEAKSSLSIKKSAELTHNIYEITYTLPDSKHTKIRLLIWMQSKSSCVSWLEKIFRVSQSGKQENTDKVKNNCLEFHIVTLHNHRLLRVGSSTVLSDCSDSFNTIP